MLNPSERNTPRVRGTTPELDERARELRRNMTPAEARLWDALRAKRLAGLKFRPQHAVGTFVFDFYCARHRLIIEVDGDVHDEEEQAAHDQMRTEHLQGCGYRVLRVRNEDVFADLPAVLQRILDAAGE